MSQEITADTSDGRVIVETRPAHVRVVLDEGPFMVPHPVRPGASLDLRSPAYLTGLDVTQDHAVWLELPNYRGRRVLLPALDSDGSRWEVVDGQYVVGLEEDLVILSQTPGELRRRLAAYDCEGADCPRLWGQISVRTTPAGATVRYGGQLLVDGGGTPLRTPVTFSTVPEPAGEGEVPVLLSPAGVALELEYPGFRPSITGVYAHMFECEPVRDRPVTGFEDCSYIYDVGMIPLVAEGE